MDTIKIHGGVALQGKVKIQGSKNASLPILAAVLMTEGESVLYNVPKISDVDRMLEILTCMGCRVRFFENEIRIQKCSSVQDELPAEAVRGMRSSVYLMGALLGRVGKISMQYPGGCVIGARPVDLHLQARECMGDCFKVYDDRIERYAPNGLHGAEVHMAFPSVGATENVILAAVLAKGRTVLYGAAKEPEIVALCAYLRCCGARICGMGTDIIVIDGVSCLSGCIYRIPGDRIVAGTYMIMTAVTGGCAFLENAPVNEMDAVQHLLRKAGCEYQVNGEGIFIQAPKELLPITEIVTEIYPGFPTDLQSAAMIMALKMPGATDVVENIFEDRFQIVPQLQNMGADIWMQNSRRARINGGNRLEGCQVEAKELRGGAALVAAGLMAGGITSVRGCQYIDRGYENICKDLRELGARIYRDK